MQSTLKLPKSGRQFSRVQVKTVAKRIQFEIILKEQNILDTDSLQIFFNLHICYLHPEGFHTSHKRTDPSLQIWLDNSSKLNSEFRNKNDSNLAC